MPTVFRSLGFPPGSKKPLLAAVSILLIHSIFVASVYPWLQPEMPLWYTLAEKNQQLAPKMWYWVLPLAAALCFAISAALAKAAKHIDVSLVQLFCWASAGLQVLWFLVAFRGIWVTW